MAFTPAQSTLLNKAINVWIGRQVPDSNPLFILATATMAQKRAALRPIVQELRAEREVKIAEDSEAGRLARVALMQAEVDDWTAVEGEL